MSVYCIVNARQKLHDPTRKIFLNEPLQYDNAQAHCFRLALTSDDGTSPADLSGMTVVANFLRPDGGTVAIDTGTITGNVVEVILPAACYAAVGRYKLTVNLVEGSGESAAARTALIVEGITERNTSGTPVDPGTIMPSINDLIAEIETVAATIPEDYTELSNTVDGLVESGANAPVRYDAAQTLTSAQKKQARTNIDAASATDADSPIVNVLFPMQTVVGKISSEAGRTVEVNRNAVTYTRVSSNSTGRVFNLTGSALRTFGTNSNYEMTTSNVQDSDFITLPKCITGAKAHRVYLWLYSPDNAELTLYHATTSNRNLLCFATKDGEGNIYLDNSGAGRYFTSGSNGFAVIQLARTHTTLWERMVTDGNLALYYITKTNNSNKNGTLYWGIGISPVDLYDVETVTGQTPVITASSGMRYNCTDTYVTSLNFTPSSSGVCSVRFRSGTTRTDLTLPQTVRMPDGWPGTEINTTYKITIEDGVWATVTAWHEETSTN